MTASFPESCFGKNFSLRGACAILWAGVAIFAFCLHSRSQQTASDYQVKAAYLYNFAKLSHWPPQALPEGALLTIGVVGGDPDFVKILTEAVAGKIVGTHPLIVQQLRSDGDLKSCQLLFFPSSERKRMQAEIAALGEASILLVGEDGSFLKQGGMINLFQEGGSIRFAVSPEALARAHIQLSSQALAQAKIEHPSLPATEDRKVEVRVAPQYPPLAQQMNLRGTVQVEAVVGRDGAVKKVTIIGGHPLLAQAASQAVMQWKYEPGPRETVEVVKVNFGSEGSGFK